MSLGESWVVVEVRRVEVDHDRDRVEYGVERVDDAEFGGFRAGPFATRLEALHEAQRLTPETVAHGGMVTWAGEVV